MTDRCMVSAARRHVSVSLGSRGCQGAVLDWQADPWRVPTQAGHLRLRLAHR